MNGPPVKQRRGSLLQPGRAVVRLEVIHDVVITGVCQLLGGPDFAAGVLCIHRDDKRVASLRNRSESRVLHVAEPCSSLIGERIQAHLRDERFPGFIRSLREGVHVEALMIEQHSFQELPHIAKALGNFDGRASSTTRWPHALRQISRELISDPCSVLRSVRCIHDLFPLIPRRGEAILRSNAAFDRTVAPQKIAT